jgi:superfamily II DNA/RNA helicase
MNSTTTPPPTDPVPERSFHVWDLSKPLLRAIDELGFTEPTPIQDQAIPAILAGKDLTGSAQTGTGKTAAFALPILQHLGSKKPFTRCLILEPTRELAQQTYEHFEKIGKYTNIRCGLVYGGVGYGRQRDDLQSGVDVVIATPGRLLDHIQQKVAKLSQVEFLVLDEADRMLDMGFLPDVRRIIEQCPKTRQTLLFSATIPPAIGSLCAWALKDPIKIEIGQRRSPADTVRHVLYPVAENQKQDLLLALMEALHWESIIVFCRTKRGADKVGLLLKRNNHKAVVIHSDRSQRERSQALEGFKKGRFEVLVATDIASRGLDISDVTHVINYDVPEHAEDYVHRIGRTGRAQAKGDALTLFTASDAGQVATIERFIRKKLDRVKLDTFDYQYTALFDEARLGPASQRKSRGGRIGKGYFFGPARGRR